MLNYTNSTGLPATVSLTDTITGSQSYVPGSLTMPPDFTGAVNGDTVTANGQSVPPSGTAAFTFLQVGQALQQPGGGDGTVVMTSLIEPDNLYTSFHHNDPSITCMTRATGGTCANWPARVLYFDFANPTGPLLTTSPATGKSIYGNYTVLDQGTGRIFGMVYKDPTHVEVICYDPLSLTGCGELQLTTVPAITYTQGNSAITPTVSPNQGTYSTSVAALTQAADGLMYWLDHTGVLHCFNPGSFTPCANDGFQLYPTTAGLFPQAASQNIQSFGPYVFTQWPVMSDNRWHQNISCYDTRTNDVCPGFANGVIAPTAIGNRTHQITMGPVMDASGAVVGICSLGNSNSDCFSTTTQTAGVADTLPDPPIYTNVVPWGGFYQNLTTIGTRTYVATNTGRVLCYDFATSATCANYPETPPIVVPSVNYTLAVDVVNPTCIWANGDSGRVIPINALTGEVGCSTTGSVTARPQANYCDGSSAEGRNTAWSQIVVSSPPNNTYAAVAVTIRDADGDIITDSNGTVWSNNQVPAANVPIDLASIIGYSATWSNGLGGTFDTTELEVVVSFIETTADFTAPQASVTWTGDDVYQVCFKTQVAQVCDTFPISNNATFTTDATANGGASDAPAGNSSGVAAFDVAPTGESCRVHIAKTASTSLALPGQPVTYTVTITNTGTADYLAGNPVVVNDDLSRALANATYNNDASAPSGTVSFASPTLTWTGPLAANTSVAMTYSLTPNANVPVGTELPNTVSSPTSTTNCPVGSTDPSCSTVTAMGVPGLSVVKSANPATAHEVGDTIQFSFVVTNTGNVPMSGITVNDTLTAPAGPALVVTCPSTTLAAGAVMTCTAPYTVTQADVDNGSVNNTATVTGTPPSGPPTTSEESVGSVPIPSSPAMTIQKVASPGSISQVGEQIHYTFVVRNTGNTVLNDIVVTDQLAAPAGPALTITCPATTLAVGGVMTCTASPYVVTAADLDNGRVVNTANATATPPNGPQISAPPSTAEVPRTSAGPSLAIQKTAVPTTARNVGDVVQYDFVVRNTGSTELTGITVEDVFVAPAGPAITVTCPRDSLPVGGEQTCTSSPYRLTAADVANGSVNNSATVTGTSPDGSAVTSPPSTAVVSISPSPSLTVTKSASPAMVRAVGQTITYSFVVVNTGNVPLTGVTVNDTLSAPAGPALVVTCPSTTLAMGAQMVCTAPYTVTAADVDNGSVNNTATATGDDPDGNPVTSNPSTASVPAPAGSSLSIVKSANVAAGHVAGETITYSFVVTNTGDTSLANVVVTDALVAPAGPELAVTCPSTMLAAGDSMTCTAPYTLTQADVDNGKVDNSATATATDPTGGTVASPPSAISVPIPADPALTLVKTANPAHFTAAEEEITYTFVVTNSGNVPVDNVSISEVSFDGSGFMSPITCPPGPLAPGAQVTCTADYTTTPSDVDAGGSPLVNVAVANATAPDGGPVQSNEAEAFITTRLVADLHMVKMVNPSRAYTVGQQVTYTFVVTNPSGQPASNIQVQDQLVAPAGPAVTVTCPATTLAAGASMTCTSSPYTITAADVANGNVRNGATVTGTDANGNSVDPGVRFSVDLPIATAPSLALTKIADRATAYQAGDQINYSFLVTNTGNVEMTGVTVTDTLVAPAGPEVTVTCPATTLAAGASMTCTSTPYTVTAADVANGGVDNSATASGTDPAGVTSTTPPSTATVDIPSEPGLTILKTADPATTSQVGETITYSFLVTNTGNVELTGVAVTDTLAAPAGPEVTVTCPSTTLAIGASMTCTSTPYTTTNADAANGTVNNSATASGTDPSGGTTTSPPSTTSVPVPASAAISIVKSADRTTVDRAGDIVNYSYVVTNTGSVPLTDVTVDDQLAAPGGPSVTITCPSTTLAVGASMTCTASPYTVTQADADSGELHDTATAVGTPPNGPPVQAPQSTVVIPIPPAPDLTVDKSADPTTVANAGDTVTYSFLVTNTGNVSLTNLTITETEFSGTGTLSPISCPTDPVAPGATATCTATYTLTQADVDTGSITNTATATGNPPVGPAVTSPPSSAEVTAPPNPSSNLVKSADPATIGSAGQLVTYSFVVTNTGNVTLTDVTVTETSFTGTGTPPTPTCPTEPLAPGASVTCTATYTTTQADISAGKVDNTAIASGTAPDGTDTTTPPSTATVEVPPSGAGSQHPVTGSSLRGLLGLAVLLLTSGIATIPVIGRYRRRRG
nr:hypothetical protein GCM10017745_49050 [Saccharothrix mutabilis subsp. capreolus]